MNIEKLCTLLDDLLSEYEKNNILSLFQTVISALSKSVSQPNAANSQSLKESLEVLYKALDACHTNNLVPSRYEMLRAIGGVPRTGIGLRKSIEKTLNVNNITPSNALAEMQVLHQEITAFHTTIVNLTQGFAQLNIKADKLNEDEFEIGLIIPSGQDIDNLAAISKELRGFDKLFRLVGEVVGGDVTSSKIRAIGSGSYDIFLLAAPLVATFVIKSVERLLGIYKSILEVRLLRKQLEEKNFPKDVIDKAKYHEESVLNSELTKLRDELFNKYSSIEDKGRINEIKNGLLFELKFLASRLDMGVKIEVSTPYGSAEDVQEAEGKKSKIVPGAKDISIAELSKLGRVMVSFKKSEGPVLMLTKEVEEKDEGKD